jgi:energy-coupling factor transport system ATP-binding protein
MVATHDTEFAATFAERVVLMGQGVVIADGAAAAILSGGWHFATEVARVLGGAGGALTPEDGVPLIDRELVAR